VPLLEQRERVCLLERRDVVLGQATGLERALLAQPQRREERDLLAAEPARGEGDRLCRGTVEPVRVVDEHEQRLLRRRLREQRQGRRRRREAVVLVRGTQCERGLERFGLVRGQPVGELEHRPEERVQPGVRELRLGLDAGDRQHAHVGSGLARVLEQRALADPRLAREHEHAAATPPRVLQRRVHDRTLAAAPDQHQARVLRFGFQN
jgi:hypothetical protein